MCESESGFGFESGFKAFLGGFRFGFRPQKVESGFGFEKNRVDSDSNPDSSFCLAITTLLQINPLHSNYGLESKLPNTNNSSL